MVLTEDFFDHSYLGWLGADNQGLIGYFTTDRWQTFPKLLVGEDGLLDPVFTYFTEHASLIGKAVGVRAEKLLDHGFMSERGVFSFDLVDPAKEYRLVSYPTVPLRVDQTPPQIQQYFQRVRFEKISFQSVTSVDGRKLHDTAEGESDQK